MQTSGLALEEIDVLFGKQPASHDDRGLKQSSEEEKSAETHMHEVVV